MFTRFSLLLTISLLVMNLLSVTLLTLYIMKSVPFDMDKIRYDYIQQTKYDMREACLHGTDFTPRTKEHKWGDEYPVEYCNKFIDEQYEDLYENAGKLGRKDIHH